MDSNGAMPLSQKPRFLIFYIDECYSLKKVYKSKVYGQVLLLLTQMFSQRVASSLGPLKHGVLLLFKSF